MRDNEYNRTNDLKKKLNEFIYSITKVKSDYFAELKQEEFIDLKSAVSDINNIFTLKLTLAFAKWLKELFRFDDEKYQEIINAIDRMSPNANGFDIKIEELKILVEIKAVVPINNGNYYGAAQRNSILSDAIKLKEGKGKNQDTDNYYKFIGVIDIGEKTDKAIEKILTPYPEDKIRTEDEKRLKMHKVVKDMEWINEERKIEELSKRKIYIKKIRIE